MTPDFPFTTPAFDQEYPRIWSTVHPKSIPFSSEMEKSGFWVRSIAYLIDKTVLSIVGLLFFFAFRIAQGSIVPFFQNFFATFILMYCAGRIIDAAYFTYFYGYTGQTIGKMVCGLKVVSTEGGLIGYRRAFLRWIGYIISFYAFFLGFFWIVFDYNKQGWHDKIARTFVIKV
jgi:uncharacterized RDD family membrane protein YckC